MENITKNKIILKCVKEKSKLRIKFHVYFDSDGKIYSNAYNNNYNCKFPKDIRVEGRYFEIGENDLTTVITRGKPFYNVNKKNIKILDNYNDPKMDISNIKIYQVDDCVVCYCEKPSVIIMPCGHQCTCNECFKLITDDKQGCPLCRKHITSQYYLEGNNIEV